MLRLYLPLLYLLFLPVKMGETEKTVLVAKKVVVMEVVEVVAATEKMSNRQQWRWWGCRGWKYV